MQAGVNNALELTGLSSAEIEVGFVVAVHSLARLALQRGPAAQLVRSLGVFEKRKSTIE